jgi:AcrR family transcriptional regulator
MASQNYHHGDLKNALIEAGAKILSEEGAAALTLRKVARQAGVSHSAPYAHFADKQALIAAISTEGFKKLYAKTAAVIEAHVGNPLQQLIEAAWAYIEFSINNPSYFRIMFSSVLEKEKDYPEFVEISQQTFAQVVEIVAACQKAGILRPAPDDLMAVAVWGHVHGIISLALEGQISHTITDRFSLRDILLFTLDQITLVPVGENP